ncbi:MAG: DUF1810 domain-containing protein [Gammaproteobacteria bacterium]|nr:MAG: DUF1810 domain-containing protein [Gammaproteobacteria bacterium]
MVSNNFNLGRFLDAQKNSYSTALAELLSGRKQSHWMWYVFPQLKGLGQSYNAEFFGLDGLPEARAYLAHPILGQRLKEAIKAVLAHKDKTIVSILGELDSLKLRSCLTLFSLAAPAEQLFTDAMKLHFAGEADAQTIALLKSRLEI